MVHRTSRRLVKQKRGKENAVNLNDELRRDVDRKDCHFGIVNYKKLDKVIVSCPRFSIIIKFKSKFLAIFVKPDRIFILDQNCLLKKRTISRNILNFINGFSLNRKLVVSKLKKQTKKILSVCFKFILELYRNTSLDKIIYLLNLMTL